MPGQVKPAVWGEPYDTVERVLKRELAGTGLTLGVDPAAASTVRHLMLAAYRQGQADEREKWEPPF